MGCCRSISLWKSFQLGVTVCALMVPAFCDEAVPQNLLNDVDLATNGDSKKWRRVQDGVEANNLSDHSFLKLPVEVPLEYDLEVELSIRREKPGAANDTHIEVPVGADTFTFVVRNAKGKRLLSFFPADGSRNGMGKAPLGATLTTARFSRRKLTFEVRKSSVKVALNGKALFTADKLSRIRSTAGRQLRLGSWQNLTVFHAVELTPLEDEEDYADLETQRDLASNDSTSGSVVGKWLTKKPSTWQFFEDGRVEHDKEDSPWNGKWKQEGTQIIAGTDNSGGDIKPFRTFEVITLDTNWMTVLINGDKRRYTFQQIASNETFKTAKSDLAASGLSGGSTTKPNVKGSPSKVIVSCRQPELVQGLQLRVNYFDRDMKCIRTFLPAARFDSDGRCEVTLPSSRYQFEALGKINDKVIALRSSEVSVNGSNRIELPVADPVQLKLTGVDDEEVLIEEVGIRSGSDEGQLKWRLIDSPKPSVSVILSPDETYVTRIVGQSETDGDSVTYAIWGEIDAESNAIEVSRNDVSTCRFTWARDSLPASDHRIALEAPDTTIRLRVDSNHKLLTNRRFFCLRYWMETHAGRRIAFQKRAYVMPEPGGSRKIQIGGRIRPVGAAKVTRVNAQTKRVSWFVELHDGAGHVVAPDLSKINLQKGLQRKDGTHVRGEEIEGSADKVNALAPQLQAVAKYNLTGEPERKVIPLAGFKPVSGKHFHSWSPKTWDWRTACYLEKCKRIRLLIRTITGRDRGRTKVEWHSSRVSLGGSFGISVPIGSLEYQFDFYDHHNPVIHEILHAFGYSHGDEMKRVNNLVWRRYLMYRWWLTDNPQYVPAM